MNDTNKEKIYINGTVHEVYRLLLIFKNRSNILVIYRLFNARSRVQYVYQKQRIVVISLYVTFIGNILYICEKNKNKISFEILSV